MNKIIYSVIAFFMMVVSAFASIHGHPRVASPRSMLNIGLFGVADYAYINFLRQGDSFVSPVGLNFTTGTCYWNSALLDTNGWPNNACANGLVFGGGYYMPSQTQFSGQFSFDGSGLGVIALNLQIVVQTGVSCGGVANGVAPNNTGSGWGYISVSAAGGIVTNDTTGTGFCVPFKMNASNTAPSLNSLYVQNTCSTTSGACTGAFVKDLRLYQQTDYARLALGKIFRTEYLQSIASLNPSAIRMMEWGSGNGLRAEIRYENRTKVTTTTGSSGTYWLASPPYTVSSGANLMSVAAVAGTPVSMTHGEIATFRIGTSMPTASACTNGAGCARPTTITNANPGNVTTNIAHGFSTGDVIIHRLIGVGMPKLNLYPVCAQVIDATHYTMKVFTVATNTCTATDVDTTTWGAFVSNVSDAAAEYVSLNVGSRLNAPIVTADGSRPVQVTAYAAVAGGYVRHLVYDKNSCAITDGAGNLICGAWLTGSFTPLPPNPGTVYGFSASVPLEYITEFVNEVNALLVGGQNPVALWITLPYAGLLPTDPDYSIASDYPLNAAKTIISGTYPLCSGCPLIIEDDNEWWNSGYESYQYFSRQNTIRYGGGGSSYFGTLRTVQMFEDIHNNSGVYNPSIFKFAMMSGPAPAVGDPNLPTTGSYIRLFGDPVVMTDPRWPNPNSPPYAYFDYYGYGPYVAASSTFYTDNFATMVSNWCTAQAAACAATPPYAPNCVGAVDTSYCLPFVNGIVGPATVEYTTITDMLTGDALFKKAAYKVGKSFVQYEGSANWQTAIGHNTPSAPITTLAQSNFLIAIYQSQSWANAWAAYCKTATMDTSQGGCGNLRETQVANQPSNFIWSYTAPDTFGSTLTEGGGLIPLWNALGTVNTGQP